MSEPLSGSGTAAALGGATVKTQNQLCHRVSACI